MTDKTSEQRAEQILEDININSQAADLNEKSLTEEDTLKQKKNQINGLGMNYNDYMDFKSEIKAFFSKQKDKRVFINPFATSSTDLANEYVNKIRPILIYLSTKNSSDSLTSHCKKMQEKLDSLHLENYLYKLNGTHSHSYDLTLYKLNRVMSEYDNTLRTILSLMYAAQPTKERRMSRNVVGVGADEFNEIMDEEI